MNRSHRKAASFTVVKSLNVLQNTGHIFLLPTALMLQNESRG
jgi:hypothetical protein